MGCEVIDATGMVVAPGLVVCMFISEIRDLPIRKILIQEHRRPSGGIYQRGIDGKYKTCCR